VAVQGTLTFVSNHPSLPLGGVGGVQVTIGGVLSTPMGTVLNEAQFTVGLLLGVKTSSSVVAQSVAK
jgi:hypothetical protein